MRTIGFLLVTTVFLALSSFGQKANVDKLLEKQETRTEIFNTIMNDHELMMDFMDAMQDNEHAMKMMRNKGHMMGNQGDMPMQGGHMMNQSQMQQMMKENPQQMHQMMGNMMDMYAEDSATRSTMMKQMKQHPDMMNMMMNHMHGDKMMHKEGKDEHHSGCAGEDKHHMEHD
ncbi:MAG: hypothetical protein K9I68_07535 [Bacteroidales bacterium]|nr:hypothetical protein [Bacteroidales bacterium]MCF8338351.1 hypothetical protein [Bacteroidales bacterium]